MRYCRLSQLLIATAGTFLLGLAVGNSAPGPADAVFGTVEANRIVIKDQDGTPALVIGLVQASSSDRQASPGILIRPFAPDEISDRTASMAIVPSAIFMSNPKDDKRAILSSRGVALSHAKGNTWYLAEYGSQSFYLLKVEDDKRESCQAFASRMSFSDDVQMTSMTAAGVSVPESAPLRQD